MRGEIERVISANELRRDIAADQIIEEIRGNDNEDEDDGFSVNSYEEGELEELRANRVNWSTIEEVNSRMGGCSRGIQRPQAIAKLEAK